MSGYGVGFGQTLYPNDFESILEGRGLPEDQARPAIESSGFVREYGSQLYLPADANDPAGAKRRMVGSSIAEFSNASGAASLFSFLEGASAIAPGSEIAMSAPIGDQSAATHASGLDAVTGQPFDRINLRFLSGRFQAEVVLLDLQGQVVRMTDAEKLAQQLFTRLESGLTRDGGGLSGVALRMNLMVDPHSDQYVLVAGQAIPQYGEAAKGVDWRTSTAAANAEVDIYKVQQKLDVGSDAPDDDVWYLLRLTRFTDATAASSWMAGIRSRISSNTEFANVTFRDGPAFGDESVSYTLTTADGMTRYRAIAFRIGAEVATIDLTSASNTEQLLLKALPALLLALADAQANCLEAAACTAPFGVHLP
jgi:hypothetical protein